MRDIFTAGDTLDAAYNVVGFPANAGWTFVLRLLPQVEGVGAPIDINTVPDADGVRHRAQYGPAETTTWKPASYTLIRWIEKAGARYPAEVLLDLPATVKILPDLAEATFYDGRSVARKSLDDVLAFRAGATSPAIKEYEINGRRLVYCTPEELKVEILRLKAEVANEDRAVKLANGINPRHVHIRWGRA